MAISDEIKNIKKDFFRYRNGVIALNLRNNGDNHEYIMGCMLPEITSIASKYIASEEIAITLWGQTEHRECRLAATMLFPVECLDYNKALELSQQVKTKEEADVLCHRLLRKYNGALKLWRELISNDDHIVQYTGLRLLANLIAIEKEFPTDDIKVIVNTYARTAPKYLAEMANDIISSD